MLLQLTKRMLCFGYDKQRMISKGKKLSADILPLFDVKIQTLIAYNYCMHSRRSPQTQRLTLFANQDGYQGWCKVNFTYLLLATHLPLASRTTWASSGRRDRASSAVRREGGRFRSPDIPFKLQWSAGVYRVSWRWTAWRSKESLSQPRSRVVPLLFSLLVNQVGRRIEQFFYACCEPVLSSGRTNLVLIKHIPCKFNHHHDVFSRVKARQKRRKFLEKFEFAPQFLINTYNF